MKICVLGIWHLGSVTSVCLSSLNNKVTALDYDKKLIKNLNNLNFPIQEPGLISAAKKSFKNGNLKFIHNIDEIPNDLDYLWVTYDTPVNFHDKSNIDFVINNITKTLDNISRSLKIIISSQLPVGTIKKLEIKYKDRFDFIVIPENLRLGNAMNAFYKQKRILVGLRNNNLKTKIKKLLVPLSKDIKFMRIESAEMAKHAINSFLALSISFANELASISELVGADYGEVEEGLKSEERIGYKSYLAAGSAFAGGTLARDIEFLKSISSEFKKNTLKVDLIRNIKISNNNHKKWIINKINNICTNLESKKITIWGLSYKENSDTLRRSLAVEIGNYFLKKGSKLKVFDPLVSKLPSQWKNNVTLFSNHYDSIKNTDILIVCTNYSLYKKIKIENLLKYNKKLIIIDQNKILENVNGIKYNKNISYYVLGRKEV